MIKSVNKLGYFNEFLILFLTISISLYNLDLIVTINFRILNYLVSLDNLYLAVLISLEISFFLLILVSWIIFLIRYRNRWFLLRFLFERFKLLPFRKKVLLLNFTLFVSVPNRVYIHNNTSIVPTFLMNVYALLFIYICPVFFFPCVIYTMLVIESIVFGTLYGNFDNFANQIHEKLFNDDLSFFNTYIREFWGKS